MLMDRENFEEWMRRIMERFDRLENRLNKPEKREKTVNGEKPLDSQDLCFMLNCSKRALQRFRVSGLLPCKRINQKTYYLESDVTVFIREYLKTAGKGNKGNDTAK